MKELSSKQIFSIGLMLFALFFGAGNMIFPPSLGQAAGTNLWIAMLGFIITGVGLPILAVATMGLSGGNLQSLASRVHPVFGMLFTLTVYLAIGPFFAIPRTGSVAFEMGALPFLPEDVNAHGLPLFLYTLVYFAVTFWLCLNPSKLVDRIGKILTPVLLVIIGALLVQSIFHPIGTFAEPASDYQTKPFFKGFLEGYLTMDALAALVFGIVVTSAIEQRGVTERKKLALTTIKAGVIAGCGLAAVYATLGYLGASSHTLGTSENGGQILAAVVAYLFGKPGALLLGTAVTLACLTTSVGLVAACSEYFTALFPKLSYKATVAALCLFSMVLANLGLSQIISISVPVMIGMYPLAIMLIVLSFMHRWFNGYRQVYAGTLIATALISVVDGFNQAGIQWSAINQLYSKLPFYAEGIAWLLPALLGGMIGYAWGLIGQTKRAGDVDQKPLSFKSEQ